MFRTTSLNIEVCAQCHPSNVVLYDDIPYRYIKLALLLYVLSFTISFETSYIYITKITFNSILYNSSISLIYNLF